MKYPKIGISTSFKDREQQLSFAYVEAVEQAGGMPVIIPVLQSPDMLHALVSELDALVITGGPAITKGLIGALPDDLASTDPIRVRSDAQLLDAFWATRKPILGICYGMQLLNAHTGGTIYADVTAQVPDVMNHSFTRDASNHSISLEKNSTLYHLLSETHLEVNTRHTQALASVGTGFRVVATAPDGVIEAIEHETAPIIGVQFHPERMLDTMLPLFRHLIQQASR
jgi:putative glutamine amidotransferase